MNSFVVVLSCLAAVTLANPRQEISVEYFANGRTRCRLGNCNSINAANCPPTNCPPPVQNPSCGPPDCSIPANRVWLHPAPDANDFYQCVQDENENHVPKLRPCACGTFFQRSENRCVHFDDWRPDCQNQQSNRRVCVEDCITCDDGLPIDPPTNPPPNGTPPPTFPPVFETTPPAGTPPPGENNCPCPCVPCIWWPCLPCMPTCACQNQPQQQNPWQRPAPLPQPQPNDPWNRPQQDNWNRPQQPQDNWNRPQQPQDNWNRPQQPQDNWNRPQQDNWNRPQQRPQDNWNSQW